MSGRARGRAVLVAAAVQLSYLLALVAFAPSQGADLVPLVLVPVVTAGWLLGVSVAVFSVFADGLATAAILAWRSPGSVTLSQGSFLAWLVVGVSGVVAAMVHQALMRQTEIGDALRAEALQRREAEALADRRGRLFATLSAVNEAVVRAHDEQEVFQEACRIFVQEGGARMAWIGVVGTGGRVDVVASHGEALDYLEGLDIDISEDPRGQGPTGAALRERRAVIVEDIATDPRMGPWRERALAHGFRSSAAFPMVWGGSVASLTIYGAEVGFFAPEIARLLDTYARDLSLGLTLRAHERAVRRSEERFRLIAENISEVIFLVAPDFSAVDYVSPAYERVTQRPSSAALSDPHSIFASIHPDDQPRVLEGVARVAGGERGDMEYRFRRADGAQRWAHVRAAPIRSANGTTLIAGVLDDVTDQREAVMLAEHARIQEAEVAKLRAIADFKTQFLNQAAHDLATPITPLSFQTALLLGGDLGPLTPEQRAAVETLSRNLDRLGDLVRDLLDAARLEAGRIALARAATDLRRLAVEAARCFDDEAKKLHIELDVETGPACVAPVDERRLQQVLYNLISNALKFTPEGGRVRVRTLDEGNAVVVRVEDTGVGIEADQIARLFQPFIQLQPSPLRGPGGTGLGLYISKGIVEQHGGRMACESAGAGKGSTFWFTIPKVTTA